MKKYIYIILILNFTLLHSQQTSIRWSESFKNKEIIPLGEINNSYYIARINDENRIVTSIYTKDLKIYKEVTSEYIFKDKEIQYCSSKLLNDKLIHFIKEFNFEEKKIELFAYIYDLNLEKPYTKILLSTCDLSKISGGIVGLKNGTGSWAPIFQFEIKFSPNNNYFFIVQNNLIANGGLYSRIEKRKQIKVFEVEKLDKPKYEYTFKDNDYYINLNSILIDNTANLYITLLYHFKNDNYTIQSKNLYSLIVVNSKLEEKVLKYGFEENLATTSLNVLFEDDKFYVTGFKSDIKEKRFPGKFYLTEYDSNTLQETNSIEKTIENLYPKELKSKDKIPYVVETIKKFPNNEILIVTKQFNIGTEVEYGDIAILKLTNKSEVSFVYKIPYYLKGNSLRKTGNTSSVCIDNDNKLNIFIEDNLDNINYTEEKNYNDVSNFNANKNGIYLYEFSEKGLINRQIIINQKESNERLILRNIIKTSGNFLLLGLEQIGVLKF